MSVANVTASAAYTAYQPATTAKRATAAADTHQAPQGTTKKTTDTVTISKQAQALANSKGYSPAEEMAETSVAKAFELTLGQR